MSFPFLKVSAATIAAVTIALGTLGAASVSFAQDNATPAATAAAPAVATMAATTMTTDIGTATAAATMMAPAATMAATMSSVKYPACPSTATAAATTAVTAAATVAASAVPTNTLLPTATTNPSAAYLGIAGQQVQSCGVQVLDIRPGTGAETAKLQISDVVVAVDGQAITSLDQFRMTVQGHKPGDKITLTYLRAGTQADAVVTLGAIPPDAVATAAATAAGTTAK